MEELIRKKLGEFPSCFRTYHFVEKLGKNRAQKILNKSKSEIDVTGYDTELEEIKALNFMSYMSFSIGKFDDAEGFNKRVLAKDAQNINAIVSKAWYHWYKSEFAESNEQCSLLETLKTNELQMLYGKAEHAYACSRLGMRMYVDAEKLFQEVLHESERVVVPEHQLCMWKFGLALTLKRQINILNCHEENIEYVGQEIQKCNKVLQIFLDITRLNAPGIDTHRARSFVQLGEIMNLLISRRQTIKIDKRIFRALPGNDAYSKAKKCYESGFRLDQNDVFVLERYAKYCRLSGRLDKSIELCRRAIDIRETSIGHHYLALALKKKLEGDQKRSNRNKKTPPNQHKRHHVRTLQMEIPMHQAKSAEKTTYLFSAPDSGIASMENYGATRVLSNAHFRDTVTAQPFTEDSCREEPTYLGKQEMQREATDVGEITKSLDIITITTGNDQTDRVPSGHRPMLPGASNMSGPGPREVERGVSFEEQALNKLVKSPKKVMQLPQDKIGEIISHLDKACELSENVAALYDKGLTYRAAGQLEEALSIFKSMFRNKACSLVNLANAYEQSVHCLQHQLEASEDETVLERIHFDVKEYSVKAIEIQWSLIAKQPSLKQCWSSFPTLKCLLEKDPNSKSNRKELGILHRMVHDYKGSIGCFKQVLEMETEDCGKAKIHMDIVHNCLKADDYDEAILHLDMVQGLSHSATAIDDKLFFEAHIEGALRSFTAREEEMCRLRLKNALDFDRVAENQHCAGNNGQVPEHEEFIQPEWYDVFILCDPKLETIGRNIWRLLSSLGLETTVNDDCAAPNLPRSVGLSEVIERSTHTVLILGDDMDNLRTIQINTDCVRSVQDTRRYGNIIVVKENASVKVCAVFGGFQSLTYKDGVESLTPNNKQWIKELLWMIAAGRKFEPF